MNSPLILQRGPHLFLDDYLIERSVGVERKVIPPQRFLDGPIVTSSEGHRNWQPWLTVLRDPSTQRFRMWYNADTVAPDDPNILTTVGYLESDDGVNWPGPYCPLNEFQPISFCANVLKDEHTTPAERFKFVYFANSVDPAQAGMRVMFSPDGRRWTKYLDGKAALAFGQWPDSFQAAWDPIRKRYFMIVKHIEPYTWTNAEGRTITKITRFYSVCYSRDFKTWTPLRNIFLPDSKDPGVTEWYGATGWLTRGDLMVGFLAVLRDDLSPEGAPREAIECNQKVVKESEDVARKEGASPSVSQHNVSSGSGMGYTVLTWTRDGEHWERDRHTAPYFEPNPKVRTWDHAVSWITCSLPVGDDVFLYYGGYRWGHKYRWKHDRQIGVLKVKRDRFVAREANENQGTLATRVVTLNGETMTLNADAARGEVRVQITGIDGAPLPGFSFSDCRPVSGDTLSAPVVWKQPLASLKNQPVRLEFSLRQARLFAVELGH